MLGTSLLFTFIFWWNSHPFYISLTDIRYNPQTTQLEISQKIFWDDLEVALAKEAESPVDFLNPADPERLQQQIERYLLTHNRVRINGKWMEMNYLGFEIEEDAAWFYLESGPATLPEEVEIHCTILVDDFRGQQNIVNFFRDKKPKSLILTKNKPSGSLKLR
ncbi:MAG: DUF6702 family protein [Nitritalea sp.]